MIKCIFKLWLILEMNRWFVLLFMGNLIYFDQNNCPKISYFLFKLCTVPIHLLPLYPLDFFVCLQYLDFICNCWWLYLYHLFVLFCFVFLHIGVSFFVFLLYYIFFWRVVLFFIYFNDLQVPLNTDIESSVVLSLGNY